MHTYNDNALVVAYEWRSSSFKSLRAVFSLFQSHQPSPGAAAAGQSPTRRRAEFGGQRQRRQRKFVAAANGSPTATAAASEPSPPAAASTEATADGLGKRNRIPRVEEVASQQPQQEEEVRHTNVEPTCFCDAEALHSREE